MPPGASCWQKPASQRASSCACATQSRTWSAACSEVLRFPAQKAGVLPLVGAKKAPESQTSIGARKTGVSRDGCVHDQIARSDADTGSESMPAKAGSVTRPSTSTAPIVGLAGSAKSTPATTLSCCRPRRPHVVRPAVSPTSASSMQTLQHAESRSATRAVVAAMVMSR